MPKGVKWFNHHQGLWLQSRPRTGARNVFVHVSRWNGPWMTGLCDDDQVVEFELIEGRDGGRCRNLRPALIRRRAST